jgi:DNA-binding transcriptional LysR family regulator
LNIFHMRCFFELTTVSTFYEAAEKLYLSQSSFSNNIQMIENATGTKLVERGARRFELTEAGQIYAKYAEKITTEYDRMTELLEQYKRDEDNRIMLFAEPMVTFGLNAALIDFRCIHPQIHIEITEIRGTTPSEILEKHKNAMCVVFSKDGVYPDNLVKVTMLNDTLAALVTDAHPLSGAEIIKLNDLGTQETKVLLPRLSPFLSEYILEQFSEAGIKPNIAPHKVWYSAIPEAIREQDTVAVIPMWAARIFGTSKVKMLKIEGSKPYYIDLLMDKECKHHAALKFFEYVQEYKVHIDTSTPW